MYIIAVCDRFQPASVYTVIFAWKYGGAEQISRGGLLRFALDDFLIAANACHARGLRRPIPIAPQRGPEKTSGQGDGATARRFTYRPRKVSA